MVRNLRLFILAVIAIAAAAGIGFAGPAAALPYALDENTCTGGAATARAAFAIAEADLDCGSGRFSIRDRFVRAKTYVEYLDNLPPRDLILQTDSGSFDSMLIRFGFEDGSVRTLAVDRQAAVRNWEANGKFWMPVPRTEAQLTTMDIVVERPRSPAVLERLELAGRAEAARLNYWQTLLYILICGMLLVPIVYDLLFSRVLQARFMAWHIFMTVATLAYVLFDSGLVLLIDPDMPAHIRFSGRFVTISLVILGVLRFSLLIVEDNIIPKKLDWALTLVALTSLGIALLMVIDLEPLRLLLVDLHLFATIPVVALTVATMAIAINRGSRISLFLAVAYLGLVIAGGVQIYAGLFGPIYSSFTDYILYAALILLVLGTSAAVGDRFMVIKADRDRAHLRAQKLDAVANSDGLTGLLNRRAFDQHERLPRGKSLLLADIDRFKAVNDSYGHQKGDAVLVHAAAIIMEAVSKQGDCQTYRLGGEEFAVLCDAEGDVAMHNAAEALRMAIETGGSRGHGPDMPPITISVGAVMGHGQLMHEAFADADRALYRAKSGGRNRVELATEPEFQI